MTSPPHTHTYSCYSKFCQYRVSTCPSTQWWKTTGTVWLLQVAWCMTARGQSSSSANWNACFLSFYAFFLSMSQTFYITEISRHFICLIYRIPAYAYGMLWAHMPATRINNSFTDHSHELNYQIKHVRVDINDRQLSVKGELTTVKSLLQNASW